MEGDEQKTSSQNELHDQYSIELWPKGKVWVISIFAVKYFSFSHRGNCVGLVVENGYMFEMDPDMSSFPVITWHCPKLRSLLQEYSPCQYSGNL